MEREREREREREGVLLEQEICVAVVNPRFTSAGQGRRRFVTSASGCPQFHLNAKRATKLKLVSRFSFQIDGAAQETSMRIGHHENYM